MPTTFIYETDNNRVQRFIALSILILLCAAGLIITFANTSEETTKGEWYDKYVPDIASNITLAKLLVIGFLSGTILFPLPVEIAFFFALKQGAPPLLSVVLVVMAVALGNGISYFLGIKLSNQVSYLLSAKKLYAVRRQVNKYGAWAILVMNLIPAPSDLLTFGLGMIRYNAKRLFSLLIVGSLIKYVIIAFAVYLLY